METVFKALIGFKLLSKFLVIPVTGLFIAGCILLPVLWPVLTVVGIIVGAYTCARIGAIAVNYGFGDRHSSSLNAAKVIGGSIGMAAILVGFYFTPPLPLLIIALTLSAGAVIPVMAAVGAAVTVGFGVVISKIFSCCSGSSENSSSVREDHSYYQPSQSTASVYSTLGRQSFREATLLNSSNDSGYRPRRAIVADNFRNHNVQNLPLSYEDTMHERLTYRR